MSKYETIVTPPAFDSNKFLSCLEKMEKAVGIGPKKDALRQTLSYVFSSPKITIESVTYLSNKTDKNSKEIFGLLITPEKIVEFVSQNSKKAGKNDYIAAFDIVGNESFKDSRYIAAAMIAGYLMQPTVRLKKAENTVIKQRDAAKLANEVGRSFAEALLDYKNQKVKKLILNHIIQFFSQSGLNINTLVDFLLVNSRYGTPKNLAMEADEILRFLDLETILNTKQSLLENYSRVSVSSKNTSLIKIWGVPPKPNEKFALADIDNRVRRQLAEQASNLTVKKPIILTVDTPFITNLGFNVALDTIKRNTNIFKLYDEYLHLDVSIIRTPQGRLVAVIALKDMIKKMPKELKAQIKQVILRHVLLTDNEDIFMRMTSEELNSVLEFTQPADSDPRKIAKSIPRLVGKVQGGLNAISRRGIKGKFELDEESYLREMGLKEISFKQEEGRIRVTTTWNSGEFHFFLNYNYQHEGLSKLSESSRNWLLMITYSYLKAIKNQDSKIKFIGPNELDQTEVSVEVEQKRKVARIPFLRVLAFGSTSKERGKEAIEKETIFHYGVGIAQLNQLFTEAQKDPNAFSNPRSHLNREIDKLKYKESVKKMIANLIDRTKMKEHRAVWKQFDLDGKRVWRLVPDDLEVSGYDPENRFYEVTFVQEAELEGGKPREINCPGVATKIIEDIKSAFSDGWHRVFRFLR